MKNSIKSRSGRTDLTSDDIKFIGPRALGENFIFQSPKRIVPDFYKITKNRGVVAQNWILHFWKSDDCLKGITLNSKVQGLWECNTGPGDRLVVYTDKKSNIHDNKRVRFITTIL